MAKRPDSKRTITAKVRAIEIRKARKVKSLYGSTK